jgi:hypothetical protein
VTRAVKTAAARTPSRSGLTLARPWAGRQKVSGPTPMAVRMCRQQDRVPLAPDGFPEHVVAVAFLRYPAGTERVGPELVLVSSRPERRRERLSSAGESLPDACGPHARFAGQGEVRVHRSSSSARALCRPAQATLAVRSLRAHQADALFGADPGLRRRCSARACAKYPASRRPGNHCDCGPRNYAERFRGNVPLNAGQPRIRACMCPASAPTSRVVHSRSTRSLERHPGGGVGSGQRCS